MKPNYTVKVGSQSMTKVNERKCAEEQEHLSYLGQRNRDQNRARGPSALADRERGKHIKRSVWERKNDVVN